MERVKAISKSMLSYLKRAREQKEFLLKETKEFERGKRHLANMMGIESQEMTQEDVDKAIRYLFPSGLFDKRARPMMKHPDLIYKAVKDAQFDIEGRPHHYLFYTALPNYYEHLGRIRDSVFELNNYEDEQLAYGVLDPPDGSKYNTAGRRWLEHLELCDKFLEKISDRDYEYLILSLKHLADHKYSERAKSLLDEFSVELPGQSLNLELPEILKDEESGQIYTDVTCKQREHIVRVKTVLNGTGRVEIEGHDILYFQAPYMRRGLLYPLQLSGMLDKVDIYAKLVNRPQKLGSSSISGAIRYAISKSIAAYVDEETRERLRLAGLLTPDTRRKERKKFGQEGARRKYTWKKR